ncbi:hypothetical protein Leryth_000275 [Lithospermum erythrorhizon]|nr:hypothetical protein Leryth_000275 [Lithospermum erythrorhizon]
MGHHSYKNSEAVKSANHDTLASVTGSHNAAQNAALHHYTRSFRGFSAMLTPDQANKLSESDSVISLFESKTSKIHTTHSWKFLNMKSVLGSKQPLELKSDVIIGMLDSGVWPESKSFDDYGLDAVPKRFKGECVTGEHFSMHNCNRKIIGARYYSKGYEQEYGSLESFNLTFYRSARDADGHGSHTASTVAGSVVPYSSLLGLANGTARGGAPGARLAIYKVCWFGFCSDADVLSAMDDAISDGVDIMSISLGPDPPQPSYFSDAISIGSFHAFQKGIVVSASAGNSGFPGTVTNAAPWILSVAASTIDREFDSLIYLNNSKPIKGHGVNLGNTNNYYELVAGSNAAAPGVPAINASFCKENTLDPTLIKGKIIVCMLETVFEDRREKAVFIKKGGGVGIILIDPLAEDLLVQFVIQGVVISPEAAPELLAYIASYKKPMARITHSVTVLSTKPAPEMATFSSKGPNSRTPDIIKPDITAPGVNILAAWSPVSTESTAGRELDYNILSGTSMACPHASAAAAIIKSYHPSWSAAAIKSAIMTTAFVIDNDLNYIRLNLNNTRASPFDYGSGHLNPGRAINPGLVYDYDSNDILDLLCSKGANPAQLKNLTGKVEHCKSSPTPSYNLNYPSIAVSNMRGNLSVYRTVTYYGEGRNLYIPKIDNPSGVKVSVTPTQLRFYAYGEKLTYRLDFVPYEVSNGSYVFGAFAWIDGVNPVTSPIALNVISV